MLKWGGAVLMIVALAMIGPPQAAATLTLVSNPTTVFQQTTNNPCVIGDPSCKQPANFDYTKESGTPGGNNGSSYDLTSTAYEATGTLSGGTTDTIPLVFQIGIDVNVASGAGNEAIVQFITWDCGTSACTPTVGGGTATEDTANSYTGPTTQLLVHNGNGFSDALLQTLSLTNGHFYFFEVQWSNDSDGMEEFFIIPQGATPVPEPASLLLLGSGLVGLGSLARRRWFSGA